MNETFFPFINNIIVLDTWNFDKYVMFINLWVLWIKSESIWRVD